MRTFLLRVMSAAPAQACSIGPRAGEGAMVIGGLFLGAGVFTKLEGTAYALLFASVAAAFLTRDASRPMRKVALFGSLVGPRS